MEWYDERAMKLTVKKYWSNSDKSYDRVVASDDTSYNLSHKLGIKMDEGRTYECVVKESEFKGRKNLWIEKATVVGGHTSVPSGSFSDKDALIARQVAFKGAIDVVCASVAPLDKVEELVNRFSEILLGAPADAVDPDDYDPFEDQ